MLEHLGLDCVTLANNHALDFGADALLETFHHLTDAGIAWGRRRPDLRNDLGLVFLVTFDHRRPTRLEVIPLALDYCHTRLADANESALITHRFRRACAALGTEVAQHRGRLIINRSTTDQSQKSVV